MFKLVIEYPSDDRINETRIFLEKEDIQKYLARTEKDKQDMPAGTKITVHVV